MGIVTTDDGGHIPAQYLHFVDVTTMEHPGIAPTDDGGHIPMRYKDYMNIFSKDMAEALEPHRPIYHPLDLEADYKLPFISKINFSHWEPPGVSERMWCVNIEASISGEYQTLGGHSGWPSEHLGSPITGTGVS